MSAKNFSISQDQDGTYHFQGELTIHELGDLRDFLEESLKDNQGAEIVFSFANVGFIDASALQLLIVFKAWLEPDIKLRISSLSSEVADILSLSGLKNALL
jgi:anti-anti-sigma factor